VGRVRGEAIQDDVVFQTKLQDFKRLVRSETVTNEDPRLLAGLFAGLRVKAALKLLQANLRVGVSRFRTGVLLSGCR